MNPWFTSSTESKLSSSYDAPYGNSYYPTFTINFDTMGYLFKDDGVLR